MSENLPSPDPDSAELKALLREIEKKVLENRAHHDDAGKTIKDFRRMFDLDSSRMNQAIFNDSSSEEISQETLSTISSLVEILLRSKKK